MSNIEQLSQQQWYQSRVTAVVTIRRAQNRQAVKRALGQGTPRDAVAQELGYPERYVCMLLGEPAPVEVEEV